MVELHKHQVPKLEKAVALLVVERTTVRTECRTTINMNFRTWSTRTGVTHLPKVVCIAKSLNAIHWHTNDVVPNLFSFIVALVNGDPELVAIKTKNLGDKLPRPRDCIGLEIITKTKVAHHLEEHEMPLGATNVIEVVVLSTSTRTLLHTDSALVRRSFVANKIWLERHHSRNGEQDRWVVRNQAC